MTDAHFHKSGETLASLNGRVFRFCGIHPWNAETVDIAETVVGFRSKLEAEASLGVGEIGLDRLKAKTVPTVQREIFGAQLKLAAEMGRPVVLHGAKCWGEVVKMIRPYAGRIPAFLFHGFSRSDGLIPDIVAMNGFVGVGKAVLNDHAVNYREMVKRLPPDRILIETDYDGESDEERTSMLAAITAKVSELASLAETQFVANATSFLETLSSGLNVDMV